MLESKARQALRARAHSLRPTVIVGTRGVTETVLAELDRALTDHELIKLRLPALQKEDRESCIASISGNSGAEIVGRVGRILILYRPRPDTTPSTRKEKPHS